MLDLSCQQYYEDFEVGYEGNSLGRTVDFADVINFGNIAGDFNPVHFDKEFSAKSMVGKQMAHGLCITALLAGMFTRTEFGANTNKTLLAFTEMRELKYAVPVFFGDTIILHFTLIGKEEVDDTKGSLEFKFEVFNQKGECCQINRRVYLMAKKGYNFEQIAQRGTY